MLRCWLVQNISGSNSLIRKNGLQKNISPSNQQLLVGKRFNLTVVAMQAPHPICAIMTTAALLPQTFF